ncbi:PglL family O-oligosaccharyltransferase, partial [Erwinia sp. OLTSP20]
AADGSSSAMRRKRRGLARGMGGLGALLAAALLVPPLGLWPGEGRFIASGLYWVLAAAWLAVVCLRATSLRLRWYAAPLAGMALLSLPAVWGDTLSLPVVSRVTALWLAGLVLAGVSACRLSRGGAARLGDALVAAGVAAAVTVYVQVLAPDPQAVWMPAAGDGRPSGLFMQVNCMASFLATVIGVATLQVLRGHHRGPMGLALGVMGPALVCCQSTVGVLGAALVVVALLLLARYYRVLVVLVAVAGIALGGLAGWQSISQPAPTTAAVVAAPVGASPTSSHAPPVPYPDLVTGLDHSDGRAARVILWRAAWRQWLTHPFFGTSMGSFTRVFTEVLRDPELGYRWETTTRHPHNELLFQAVEGGLVAVSGLLLIVGWGLWRTYLAWRAMAPVGGFCAPRGDAAGWLVCCLPIALHAMVELPLYQSPLHVLVPVLLAGIGVARSGTVAGGRVWTAPPRLAPWLRALGVVVALAATVQCINNARVAGAVSVAVRSAGADIQPLRDALRWNPWVDPDEVGLGGLARSVWLYNHHHDEALRASAQAWLSDYLTRYPSPEMYRTLLQLERAGGDMTAYRQTLARAQYLFPWSSLIPATPEP